MQNAVTTTSNKKSTTASMTYAKNNTMKNATKRGR